MRAIFIILTVFLLCQPQAFAIGKYGDPNAPFKDVCGGKIKDKQDYDLTFVRTRVLRTTYFCEDGTEEYYNTLQVKENKPVKARSFVIVEKLQQQGVEPTDEVVYREV